MQNINDHFTSLWAYLNMHNHTHFKQLANLAASICLIIYKKATLYLTHLWDDTVWGFLGHNSTHFLQYRVYNGKSRITTFILNYLLKNPKLNRLNKKYVELEKNSKNVVLGSKMSHLTHLEYKMNFL